MADSEGRLVSGGVSTGRCAQCHFSPDDYREAADYVVEHADTATAANMLRSAADDVLSLVERLEAAQKERDALQHVIDCANTPLMRDVLRQRNEERARAIAAETALIHERRHR